MYIVCSHLWGQRKTYMYGPYGQRISLEDTQENGIAVNLWEEEFSVWSLQWADFIFCHVFLDFLPCAFA